MLAKKLPFSFGVPMQTGCGYIPPGKTHKTLEIYVSTLDAADNANSDVKELQNMLQWSLHSLNIYSGSAESLAHIRDSLTAVQWRIQECGAKIHWSIAHLKCSSLLQGAHIS